MKIYFTFLFACTFAFLLASCNTAPETELSPEIESGELSRADFTPVAAFSGPKTVKMGCTAQFIGTTSSNGVSSWEFGKKDANGNFTALPDKVRVIASNVNIYEIVILAAPGSYTIKRRLTSSTGWGLGTFTLDITVQDEGGAYVLSYVPWRLAARNDIVYASGGLYQGATMDAEYHLRAFSKIPTTSNACYNYLIPVYRVTKLNNTYTYQMDTPTSGSYTIAFYIFKSQRPGTVPIYFFKEYYKNSPTAYPPRTYTGINYFSTTSKDPGIQIPPSGPAIYTENAGVVGYAFPAEPL